MNMQNSRESNTIQMVANNYYFAKAAINSVQERSPLLRIAKQVGIATASAIIGLANLPLTIIKDELQSDTIIRNTLRYTYNDLKNVAHSKEIKPSEKTQLLGIGLVMYSIVNSVALPISLVAAPLKGLV